MQRPWRTWSAPAFVVDSEQPVPAGHPERPDRLRAIERILEDERFQTLARVQAPAASLETIALCHPMEYVESVRDAPERSRHSPAGRVDAGEPAGGCRRLQILLPVVGELVEKIGGEGGMHESPLFRRS